MLNLNKFICAAAMVIAATTTTVHAAVAFSGDAARGEMEFDQPEETQL